MTICLNDCDNYVDKMSNRRHTKKSVHLFYPCKWYLTPPFRCCLIYGVLSFLQNSVLILSHDFMIGKYSNCVQVFDFTNVLLRIVHPLYFMEVVRFGLFLIFAKIIEIVFCKTSFYTFYKLVD